MRKMRKNEALVQTLCLPYCHYYKQGKNEDLLCRGALVVERLILSGRGLMGPGKDQYHADPATRELMLHRLCIACDFRENDCDFARDLRAQPCGGFILLTGLLRSGMITIEDI
jgi:hypothetical protein